MTTRLKKKLGELGVDTSSRKANENFCLIGTPLPPLEKSKDTGEFVPLWKQDVRDEKGRRRLHGAFTGGFSAGYFNTVGSKEGWVPSTFTSSRSDRAKKAAARPEDFMDEEDLQDLKDSRVIVDNTEQMDLTGRTQAELGKSEADENDKDPITCTLQASLLPPVKESVGAKILMKMGWRLGQGIGPRVSLKERKRQDTEAYDPRTGARETSGALDVADDDEEASKHTYPRRDTPILVVKRKDNFHGLGYVPGQTLTESLGNSASAGNTGPKLAGGFGLGALNDADEDDLDVYDSNPNQGSKRRLAYEHAHGEEDDTVVIGNNAQTQNQKSGAKVSTQYFRNGHLVLSDFTLSNEPEAAEQWFPIPEVPKGWQPNPRLIWFNDKENIQAPHPRPDVQTHAEWKKSHLTSEQRGQILGETPLPSAPKSVFDYMSQKDRERIQNIASKLTSGSSDINNATPVAPHVSVSKLEPHVAQAALRGFQPFTSDPSKQARYTAYLTSQIKDDGSVPPLQALSGQKVEEFNKELEDYAKAASLFKPMSGAMAGRFTSAAVVEFGPNIQEGLHQPTHEEIAAKEAQRQKEEEDRISPKAHAAKMNMYGPLTRERKPWQPSRLLCKRFGVKDPNPEPELSAEKANAQNNAPSFTHPEQDGAKAILNQVDFVVDHKKDAPRDLANIGLGEDETQGQDTLNYVRPPMEIFKAIFASDDEDSDNDEEEKDDDNTEQPGSLPPTEVKNGGTGFTPATSIFDVAPIDINMFKPKFIPREGKKKSNYDDNSKERKEKKEKRKKEKKGVLVSFEMDEGSDGAEAVKPKQPKDRPSKKIKKDRDVKGNISDSGMWDSKIHDFPMPVAGKPPSVGDEGLLKGRKRAIDFM